MSSLQKNQVMQSTTEYMHERCSVILSREEIQDGLYNFYVGNLSRIVIPESMGQFLSLGI